MAASKPFHRFDRPIVKRKSGMRGRGDDRRRDEGTRGGSFRHARNRAASGLPCVDRAERLRLGARKSRTVLGVPNQAPPPTASPDFRVKQRSQAAGTVHGLIKPSEQTNQSTQSGEPIESRINQSITNRIYRRGSVVEDPDVAR